MSNLGRWPGGHVCTWRNVHVQSSAVLGRARHGLIFGSWSLLCLISIRSSKLILHVFLLWVPMPYERGRQVHVKKFIRFPLIVLLHFSGSSCGFTSWCSESTVQGQTSPYRSDLCRSRKNQPLSWSSREALGNLQIFCLFFQLFIFKSPTFFSEKDWEWL